MKKLTFCLAFTFFFIQFHVWAAVLTVNNRTSDPDAFRDFESAQAVANTGDTIVLIASDKDYGKIFITKSISLIGKSVEPYTKKNSTTGSISIEAPNVVVEAIECAYIYCTSSGQGSVLKGNIFKTISFYEPCDDVTLLNNTFNVLDLSAPVSNLLMVNNHLVREVLPDSETVFNIIPK